MLFSAPALRLSSGGLPEMRSAWRPKAMAKTMPPSMKHLSSEFGPAFVNDERFRSKNKLRAGQVSGHGYLVAVTNFSFRPNAVWSTEGAVERLSC